MCDEDALLAAIHADPDNQLPKLVYADWLDEQGRTSQAQYLRLTAEVDRLREQLGVLATRLPQYWLQAVATAPVGCSSVLITAFPPEMKIGLIKIIREQTGCGLAEGKHMAESLPLTLPVPANASAAGMLRGQLREMGVTFR